MSNLTQNQQSVFVSSITGMQSTAIASILSQRGHKVTGLTRALTVNTKNVAINIEVIDYENPQSLELLLSAPLMQPWFILLL